ncbi:SRPBCC domain-containing protein [Actinocrispum sp. NPDC049592]|uniref:SRPBCC family protein n=1 Tax=Actinocrispum sp. NPDC049592 TaxID=3154835 RepID=UPI00341CA4EB
MVTGQTKDVGFNIGVSKTIDVPLPDVWDFMLSDEGLRLWLGEGADLKLKEPYETVDGTVGEVRSLHPHDRVRLTWRPHDWDHDTTVQVTVSTSGQKTVLRFHQEWLADATERETQRTHWKAVMEKVLAHLTP